MRATERTSKALHNINSAQKRHSMTLTEKSPHRVLLAETFERLATLSMYPSGMHKTLPVASTVPALACQGRAELAHAAGEPEQGPLPALISTAPAFPQGV